MDELKLVAEPRAAAFELAGAGLVVTDTAGLILRANQVYAQLLGLSVKDLLGTAFVDAFPIESRALAQRSLKGALVPHALPMPGQWQLQRRSGSTVTVLLTARATAMASGRLGAVLTIIDISALSTTESRLFAALEEQRLILDNAQVGIVFTRGLSVMRYNAAFAHICDIDEGTLVGRPLEQIFEDKVPTLALAPGHRYREAHRVRRRDGDSSWCMVDGRVFGEEANGQQIIWTLRDIAQERAADEALQRIHANLEQRVVDRTRDLAYKNVELQTQIAERREIEERLRAHNEKLVFHRNQLLALAEKHAVDFASALEDIAAVAIRTLNLDRTSFWRLHAEPDVLECEFALNADLKIAPSDTPKQLSAAAQIARFASLSGYHIVSVDDMPEDSASRELLHDYMLPLSLSSLLEVPVWVEGRIVGKLSFESMRARQWSLEDIDFAAGICTLVALAQEAEQRQLAEARLRRLAHFDALTSLPNRHLLLDRLKQALAFAQRHRSRLALMFIDLDRFKTINDSLGHLVGDKLLIEVARRLTASLRAEDSVARIGGDEFVVILRDLRNVADAATVAQNLLSAIELPYTVDGRDLHVSGSVGIALYPEDGTDIETLMRNADTAMYHVKDVGRNGFEFFTASMNEQASARLTLENDLRIALKHGELRLHYQPQYEIQTGRVCAVEALLRWQHPEQGLVHPDAFISLAEESGLIQNIDEWTLAQTCAQIKAWNEAGMPPMPVAVNLSARQFRNQSFVQRLKLALEASQVLPCMLELEITESALMQDAEATLEMLSRLKTMGVRLAIDDFGTGYSSLVYLKRFPIDKLKIDRSFIRDIPGDADDVAISSAIISMSKDLGVRVVAEGVETQAQMDFLRQRGCDEAQGFLLCPPLTAQQLHAQLTNIPPVFLQT